MLEEGELIIADPDYMQRITCITPSEEVYLRIVLEPTEQ